MDRVTEKAKFFFTTSENKTQTRVPQELNRLFQIQRSFKAITENERCISDVKVEAGFEFLLYCVGHIPDFLSILKHYKIYVLVFLNL